MFFHTKLTLYSLCVKVVIMLQLKLMHNLSTLIQSCNKVYTKSMQRWLKVGTTYINFVPSLNQLCNIDDTKLMQFVTTLYQLCTNFATKLNTKMTQS